MTAGLALGFAIAGLTAEVLAELRVQLLGHLGVDAHHSATR